MKRNGITTYHSSKSGFEHEGCRAAQIQGEDQVAKAEQDHHQNKQQGAAQNSHELVESEDENQNDDVPWNTRGPNCCLLVSHRLQKKQTTINK